MPKFQYPKIKEDEVFEQFVADLFNCIENTKDYQNTEFQLFGKDGQKQKGIDIISQKHKTAIQCKCKDTTIHSFEKIRKELKSDMQADISKTKLLNFDIDRLIFTSTFIDDTILMEYANDLRNQEKLNFTIEYWGWETLTKYVEKYENLIKTYFYSNLPTKENNSKDVLTRDDYYKKITEIIEFVSVDIDSQNCSWYKDEIYETVFWDTNSENSPFPIFDFCLLNNCNSTVVLKSIKCKWKHLYSGLQGLPYPSVVKLVEKIDLYINPRKEINTIDNFNKIQIPSEQSVRFQVQVLLGLKENIEFDQFQGRHSLNFIFEFNKDRVLYVPEILLNTNNNKDTHEIHVLS